MHMAMVRTRVDASFVSRVMRPYIRRLVIADCYKSRGFFVVTSNLSIRDKAVTEWVVVRVVAVVIERCAQIIGIIAVIILGTVGGASMVGVTLLLILGKLDKLSSDLPGTRLLKLSSMFLLTVSLTPILAP